MPTLNILTLNQGDTQEDIRNKVNANFDSLVLNGGGPQGVQGPQGDQGPVGSAGSQGDPGEQGTRGTKWFVEPSQPSGGSADEILVGDYWVDTLNDNSIYQFNNSGWVSTGYTLQTSGIFSTLSGITGPTAGANAIVLNTPFPNLYTTVLSDAISTQSTANPSYSKLLIATDSANDFPLLEFAKTNAVGIGTPSDYTRHPQFRWMNPNQQNYNLLFSVPQDSMQFNSGGNMSIQSTGGDIQITAPQDIEIDSQSQILMYAANQILLQSEQIVFSSNNFQMSSSAMSIFTQVSVNANTTNPALQISNSGTGGGLQVFSNSTSSSTNIVDFQSGGETKFSINGQGKVYMKQTASSVKSISSSSDLTISGTQYWLLNTSTVNHGNTVLFVPPVSGPPKGLMISMGSFSGSWSNYLQNYESIQLSISVVDPGNAIRYLALGDSSNLIIGSAVDFGSGTEQRFINLTIIRNNSATNYLVFYNTCGGLCGKF